MAKTHVVHVTEDLVRRATQRDSQHCMIAEAIKRGDPDNIRNVWVDLQTIRWSDRKKGVRFVALTPPEAANALVSFDRGEPLEPFSFACKIIQETRLKDVKVDSEGNVMRGTTGRPLYEERRGRKSWKRSAQVIEGGQISIPLAHLGGSDAGEHPRTGEQRLEKRRTGTYRTRSAPKEPPANASNIELSRQAYRQYGRRVLKK